MEKINVNINENTQELIIRQGQAELIRELNHVLVTGIIDTPYQFLSIRKKESINFDHARLEINREDNVIRLYLNEHLKDFDQITGELAETEEFKNFKINSGESWVPTELSKFIKMNRTCFESVDTANKLASELNHIKAKVEKESDTKVDPKKGDYRIVREQIVKDCNIPEEFVIWIPIFKGMNKEKITIEVYIDPMDLSCQLVSPDAADQKRMVRDTEINRVVKEIKELNLPLVIYEA